MAWLRTAWSAARALNQGASVYRNLPGYNDIVQFGSRLDGAIFGEPSTVVDQTAADRAYVQRAMGYRLNPNTVPAIGVGSRSSRSSVGHVFYGS